MGRKLPLYAFFDVFFNVFFEGAIQNFDMFFAFFL